MQINKSLGFWTFDLVSLDAIFIYLGAPKRQVNDPTAQALVSWRSGSPAKSQWLPERDVGLVRAWTCRSAREPAPKRPHSRREAHGVGRREALNASGQRLEPELAGCSRERRPGKLQVTGLKSQVPAPACVLHFNL